MAKRARRAKSKKRGAAPVRRKASPKAAAPKKGGAGKRPSARGEQRKARPGSSLARTIVRKDKAIDELAGKVRRGPVHLGGTRRLTPTHAGFKALRGVVRAVRSVQAKKPKAYSFKLSVRYRGPDGRFKKLEPIEGSFPLPAAVRRRRKKGESEAAAFQRLTESRIKGAVFRSIERAEGVATYSPAVERALASGDRDRITRAMRSFKKRRGVSFKVDVERQVTGATSAKAKKATRARKTVRARTGQRRRRKR